MEVVGYKAGSCALDFMWTGFHRLSGAGLGNDGGISRLHRNRLKALFPGFDHFGNAGDCSARADGGDKDIHFPIRIRPDFLRSGFAVDSRVGRILELLGNEGAGDLLGQSFSTGDGPPHSFGCRSELEFGSQKGE